MLTPIQKTILYDQNAIYYGYPIKNLMERAGLGIAKILIKKYGRGNTVGFFCGPGNNGGDGFTAARYLKKLDPTSTPKVYLIPDSKKIKTKESKLNWQLFKGDKLDNILPKDIQGKFDVVVDCLFGTGITGKLRAPYPTIIKILNKIKAKKVTIDLPSPSFKSQLDISMMFAKTKNAEVVDIGYPEKLKNRIGMGEVKILATPDDKSHKGDNGKILIIGGSERYHGAPILAASIASRFVDLVYFASTRDNNQLIKKMKSRLSEFITIKQNEIEKIIPKMDAVLIGPGLNPEVGLREIFPKSDFGNLLKKSPQTKFILDAGALQILDKNLLNKNHIITPHQKEFKKLFSIAPTKENVKKMAKKYKCVIVVKGKNDYVADDSEFKINTTGNAGMTKGGTGDVLAGLITALAASNELFLASCAGIFLNGLAGDRLKDKVGYYFNASDLVKEIIKTLKKDKRK